ncbi:hypothetical protein D3C85_1226650 [compost metagenome]
MLQVQADALFAAIEGVEERTVFAYPGRPQCAPQLTFAGFDLDHPRAHVGHQHGRRGARCDLGEVQDGQPLQCVT